MSYYQNDPNMLRNLELMSQYAQMNPNYMANKKPQ